MNKDLFFSSNQKRLKKYQNDRKLEELNGDLHQAKVYAKIQSDLGDIEEANHYLKLSTNIINKFAEKNLNLPAKDNNGISVSGVSTLASVIKNGIMNGNLSQIFDQIKRIKSPNKKTQIVISDINNSSELKSAVNEELLTNDGLEEKSSKIVNYITGGDSSISEELNKNVSEFLSRGEAKNYFPHVKGSKSYDSQASTSALTDVTTQGITKGRPKKFTSELEGVKFIIESNHSIKNKKVELQRYAKNIMNPEILDIIKKSNLITENPKGKNSTLYTRLYG